MGIAAAVTAGGFGSLLVAEPAHAATAEADIEVKVGNDNLQGKAGAKTTVGFQVTNHGKIEVTVAVGIRLPSNAEFNSADYPPARCIVAGNRRDASCRLPAGGSINVSVQLTLRTVGEASGTVAAAISPASQKINDPKPGNNSAGFKLRVTGATPTPSASKSSRASRSPTAEPAETGTGEEINPPEAGNGAIGREDPKAPVSNDKGGFSFAFWIGVVAIIAALGLVGSLFYFRRKDRLEPDTGVFNPPTVGHDNPTALITPVTYGSPAAGLPGSPQFQNGQSYPGDVQPYQGEQGFQVGHGFQGGTGVQGGQSFQGGSGAPAGTNVYGDPSAPTADPYQAGPPPGTTPGANDQTVVMRRPADL